MPTKIRNLVLMLLVPALIAIICSRPELGLCNSSKEWTPNEDMPARSPLIVAARRPQIVNALR